MIFDSIEGVFALLIMVVALVTAIVALKPEQRQVLALWAPMVVVMVLSAINIIVDILELTGAVHLGAKGKAVSITLFAIMVCVQTFVSIKVTRTVGRQRSSR